VTVEVMTRNNQVEQQIRTHMPVIRNNLVLLFSSQTYEAVSTLEGKEALREEALTVIQKILEEETGDPGIEAVYFTSFVMQ
jgi:flagellar FliL protein